MKVNLKCFSKLVNPDTCNFNESTLYEIADSDTIESLTLILSHHFQWWTRKGSTVPARNKIGSSSGKAPLGR